MTLQERLILENQILSRDGFLQFQVYQVNNFHHLWGEHKTNSGYSYTIWGQIPKFYPYERPLIYVYKPNPLRSYDPFKTINSYGLSHSMHTLENGPNGEVQICHWRADRWHSGITLNRVMLKVILWLEAYEQHLSTAKPISEFVRTMSLSPKTGQSNKVHFDLP
jgi:hypothetical protein